MPLPFILGIGAALAGAAGVGSGIHGAVKMKEADVIKKDAESCYKMSTERVEKSNKSASRKADELGILELNILNGFDDFSDTIEKIQNRPEFKEYNKDGIKLPVYDKEELKKVSIGAGVLLGGLGGAAAGTAGGFAAAGATTSAVMALGTASTGTPIAMLNGAAATKATLAALGGGAKMFGGGGIALGTTVLGASTLGVGLLVGGVIFNIAGKKLSIEANEAQRQAKEIERNATKICSYLTELEIITEKYLKSLKTVNEKYLESFQRVSHIVNELHKVDWYDYSVEEQTVVQNTVLLVGLLYKMCKVNLVLEKESDEETNVINNSEIEKTLEDTKHVMVKIGVEDYSKEKVIYFSKADEIGTNGGVPAAGGHHTSNLSSRSEYNKYISGLEGGVHVSGKVDAWAPPEIEEKYFSMPHGVREPTRLLGRAYDGFYTACHVFAVLAGKELSFGPGWDLNNKIAANMLCRKLEVNLLYPDVANVNLQFSDFGINGPTYRPIILISTVQAAIKQFPVPGLKLVFENGDLKETTETSATEEIWDEWYSTE